MMGHPGLEPGTSVLGVVFGSFMVLSPPIQGDPSTAVSRHHPPRTQEFDRQPEPRTAPVHEVSNKLTLEVTSRNHLPKRTVPVESGSTENRTAYVTTFLCPTANSVAGYIHSFANLHRPLSKHRQFIQQNTHYIGYEPEQKGEKVRVHHPLT